MDKKDILYKDERLLNAHVYHLILKESQVQINKWGIQEHTLFEWLAYSTEELGELSNAISEYVYRNGTKQHIVNEAIQTSTLCLKIAEMILYNDKC